MSDHELLDRLRAVDLFSSLSNRDLKHVAESGRTVTHAPGHEILTEGGGSVGFHLILEGEALVDVGGTARPPLHAGNYFGEVSLLDGKPRTASVTAGASGLTTFSIASWDFSGLIEKYPTMAKSIIVDLCARLRVAETSASEARAAAVS